MENVKTVVKTPKGYHLWISYDPDLRTKQVKDHGFDVKNNGALVNVPPSKINGHAYFFLKSDGLGSIPEDFKNKVLNLEKKTFSKNKLLNKVLEKLTVVRQLQDGTFRCFCPAHDDQEPSLDVGMKNGRLYIHCWAGCESEEVLETIGLQEPKIRKREDNTTERLLQLAERFELWLNQNGDEFATVCINNSTQNVRIDSKEFKKILQYLYFQRFSKPAHTQAVLEAVNTLCGKAFIEGKRYKSFIRIGKHEGVLELDLLNRKVIQIAKDRIMLTDGVCKFERLPNLLPLPLPDLNVNKDDWKSLAHFINVDIEALLFLKQTRLSRYEVAGKMSELQ